VMWAILEGNTKELTWIEQQRKTLHITEENHAALKDYVRGLENVRSIGLKDQERFTSPWAVEMEDEEKFERTISLVGKLLQGDLQLQALYHMFVMMSCGNKTTDKIQTDPALCGIQVKLSQLMYRYLSTKSYFTDREFGDITEDTEEKVDTNVSYDTEDTEEKVDTNVSYDTEDIDPDTKTRLLISLVDDIHDCVDIMQNRSIL